VRSMAISPALGAPPIHTWTTDSSRGCRATATEGSNPVGDPSMHLWLAQSNKRAGVVRQVAAESSRKQPEADASRRKQTQADASRAPPRTARYARGACMHGYHTTHKTPLWRFERQQWRSPTCSLPTQLACLLLTIASVAGVQAKPVQS
jgi:hypothetical protein